MFNAYESVTEGWNNKFVKIAEAIKAGKGTLFMLAGERGCGKTQLSVCLIKMLLENGETARYNKTMDFFKSVKDTYKLPNKTENDVIKEYKSPKLLVLDEIQVRSESAWENNLLTYLIDIRYDYMLNTILIGNIAINKVRDNVGDSIYSRMEETGGIINCDWKSFRAKGSQ